MQTKDIFNQFTLYSMKYGEEMTHVSDLKELKLYLLEAIKINIKC